MWLQVWFVFLLATPTGNLSLPKMNVTVTKVFINCIVLVQLLKLVLIIPTCYIVQKLNKFITDGLGVGGGGLLVLMT